MRSVHGVISKMKFRVYLWCGSGEAERGFARGGEVVLGMI